MRPLGAILIAVVIVAAACGGEDLGGEKLPADAMGLQEASARAMGAVTSVAFTVERTDAPVFIDAAESLALDAIEGRFSAPGSADAVLDVTVNGALRTKLGAVAIDDEVWLSNPVTGAFETLPAGFDLDPSLFFDPKEGWQPLIESLEDLEFLAEMDRDGTRYHLRGQAPAAQMQKITAGLVRNTDVELDLWLHPVTALVVAIEFETTFDGATSSWVLELDQYGDSFTISDPTGTSR
ncbi:MAG: LppX_LprAFG lipoprotein [Acidimicrobiales bacterium]